MPIYDLKLKYFKNKFYQDKQKHWYLTVHVLDESGSTRYRKLPMTYKKINCVLNKPYSVLLLPNQALILKLFGYWHRKQLPFSWSI